MGFFGRRVQTLSRRVRTRLWPSVSVSLTKLSLAGAGWQAMGLLADKIGIGGRHTEPPFETTLAFSVSAGLGDAGGVFLGALMMEVCSPSSPSEGRWPHFFKATASLVVGSFLSGTAWQGALDGCYDAGMDFDIAMMIVAAICGAVFFMGVTTGRAVFLLQRDTFRDFTLAIACGCGSGFFVGTDLRYEGNWLQIFVGERTGKDTLDVFKAALSTFLGFNVGMLFLIIGCPEGMLWADQNMEKDANDPRERERLSIREQEKPGGYSILDV